MAKPNYSFEKRQRELAKKRKKEDKAARKANPQTGSDVPEENAEPAEPQPDDTTAPPALATP